MFSMLTTGFSPQCKCGFPYENAEHYFLYCPLYQNERTALFNSIRPITEFQIDHILYGNPHLNLSNNYEIFNAVHTFIKTTRRFS